MPAHGVGAAIFGRGFKPGVGDCTLQHIKSLRSGRGRLRPHSRRVGANAAFAKAMARAEFGRFYTDEQQQREVRRSLERAKARRAPQPRDREPAKEAGPGDQQAGLGDEAKPRAKPRPWRQPSVRERRTEIAEARARLAASARSRKAREGESEGEGETE